MYLEKNSFHRAIIGNFSALKQFKCARIFSLAATTMFLFTFGFACDYRADAIQTSKVQNVSINSAVNNNSTAADQTDLNTAAQNHRAADKDWKQFSDIKLGISFQYPSKLKIKRLKNGVRIFHELNFEHSDPCDNSDDVKSLKKFADFDVTILVSNEKQKITAECKKNSDLNKNADINENPVCFATNNLKGEIVYATFQGCGNLTYTFPLSDNKTLVVKRNLIPLFGPGAIPEEKKKAESLPQVILTEENNEIFFKIISSLKTD